MIWKRLGLSRHRAGLVGLALVLGLAVLAIGADVISPAERGGLGADVTTPPGTAHIMGTDDLGRDVFHRFVHGARISLLIGAVAAVTSTLIGSAIGLVAGYRGGRSDDALMRFTESIQVVPRFFLALVVAVLLGASVLNVIIIIGLLSWPGIARLVRAETLSLREQEFVLAARAVGARDVRIMLRQILPNAIAPAVVAGTLLVSQAVLTESALSFLGLGDQNRPSWGSMLHQAQDYFRVAWWLSVFPGLGVVVASLGFNLLGDGLNELLNPRLRER